MHYIYDVHCVACNSCLLAARMKLALSGKNKSSQYPQPEGSLGEAWIKAGTELDGTSFGKSLSGIILVQCMYM